MGGGVCGEFGSLPNSPGGVHWDECGPESESRKKQGTHTSGDIRWFEGGSLEKQV